MKLQFSSTFCLSFFTAAWYLVTKSNILSAVFLCLCGLRADFLCNISNVVFEEFVLSSLISSPLIKPLFTPGGWHEVK